MSYHFMSAEDRDFARRQARLSLIFVAAAALAAFILGYSTPVSYGKAALTLDADPAFGGRLVVVDAD